jgi:hypothetical protein
MCRHDPAGLNEGGLLTEEAETECSSTGIAALPALHFTTAVGVPA